MQTAIYTLMATLLFGSNFQSAFLLPDAKKEIYYVIEQPTREQEVWDILKEFNEQAKAFEKGLKLRTRGLYELFLDRNATRDDLLPLFEDSQQERATILGNYIKDRIQLQDLLTKEEWDAILNLVYEKFEKGRTGHDLEYAREQLLQFPPLRQIRKTIQKKVKDPDQRAACLQAEREYQQGLLKQLAEIQEPILEDMEKLKRQNISEKEMREIAARLKQFRTNVFQATADFRRKVLENSQAEEWDALAKAMVRLVN